ncbi:MAG: hypothetical protein Q9191_000374 [Dirinaria sp. TL-2023a]
MPLSLRPFPRYICYIRSNTSSIQAEYPTWEAFDNWLNRDLFDPSKGGDKRIIKATTTLAVVKSLVQTAADMMMDFLQKVELETGRKNGEQSEGLQKLPDVKILPATSTPNPGANIEDFGTKQ